MEDLVAELRRPVPVESVGFKVQALMPKGNPTRAQIVSYIDARLVAERLNYVIPGDWYDAYAAAPVGTGLECRLTVAGVTRCDVGFSDNTDTDIGVKALYSDAFKRACVKFGVGAFLYALPKLVVPVGELTNWNGKFHLFDNSPAMAKAQAHYTNWLAQHGVDYFGEPLSHGDSAGAQGDIEAEPIVEAGGELPSRAQLPELYVDWLRLAIRSRDSKELADEVAWKREVDAAKTPEQKKALVDRLEALAVDLDLNVEPIRERWEANKVQVEAAAS